MNKLPLRIGLLSAIFCTAVAAAPFDKSAAPVGDATFQLVQGDVVKGQMVYSTRFQDSVYVIDEATAMQPDVKETGTFVLDGETFRPMRIIIDADFSSSILDIDLQAEDGLLRGEYRTKRPGALEKSTTPFDLELPDGAVARTSMFGLVAALPLQDGDVYPIKWFSSLSARLEDIVVIVEGEKTISVPAGEFTTTVIRFKDATPENIIYVSKEERSVVRIDVPSMNMRFERMPQEITAAE